VRNALLPSISLSPANDVLAEMRLMAERAASI
jgi:hypothetical protein